MKGAEIPNDIIFYDTTLRDGGQGSGVYFTVDGKLKAVSYLDYLGIPYIEGGWPGSNETDTAFFQRVRDVKLKSSVITAFGSTRHVGIYVEDDPNIKNLISSGTRTVTLLAKASLYQVLHVLRTTDQENLDMIADSVAYLKEFGLEVGIDAEHLFDGYKYNPAYTIETLKTAIKAGADWITLCDTRGGSMMDEIESITRDIVSDSDIPVPIGIHTHDDCDLAVANTIVAIRAGARQVQGTINGYGERTGNANLLALIAILQLKMGIPVIDEGKLNSLTEISREFEQITGCPTNPNLAFTGINAFTHRAGLHADGVLKRQDAYEHIVPETVGNKRSFAISEQGGTASIEARIQDLHLPVPTDRSFARRVTAQVKHFEAQGFQFESASASFELLIRRMLPDYVPLFKLDLDYSNNNILARLTTNGVSSTKDPDLLIPYSNNTAGRCQAFLNIISKYYPELEQVKLVSLKSQPINSHGHRVFVELANGESSWVTVYADKDEVTASWFAIRDAVEHALIKLHSDNSLLTIINN